MNITFDSTPILFGKFHLCALIMCIFINVFVYFLLKDKEEAIGAARFRDYNGRGKLERICVLSDKRKTGAGKTIVLGIEEYAKQKGYKSFFLNSQVQAIPFYEKLGYEVCSDIFMDAGIPHKSMKKIFTK